MRWLLASLLAGLCLAATCDSRLFDADGMLGLLGQDMEIACFIAPDLARGVVTELGRLQVACASGDRLTAERAAHTMKGLAGSLCAGRIRDLSLACEIAAREQKLKEITEHMPELAGLVSGLEAEVGAWVAAQQPA